MTLIEFIGYYAFGLDVVATWLFTRKHIWAWPCSLLALIGWFVYGWLLDQRPMLVSATTFFVICLWGWYKWWQDEQQTTGESNG